MLLAVAVKTDVLVAKAERLREMEEAPELTIRKTDKRVWHGLDGRSRVGVARRCWLCKQRGEQGGLVGNGRWQPGSSRQHAWLYLNHSSFIRVGLKFISATTAMEAWVALHAYYNRQNLHNRIALTRRLHELKCGEPGHTKRDCSNNDGAEQEISFAAGAPCSGWLLDSGASSHMSPYRADFSEIRQLLVAVDVKVADGTTLHTNAVGVVKNKLESGRVVSITEYRSWRERGLQWSSRAESVQSIARGAGDVATAAQEGNAYHWSASPIENALVVEMLEQNSWELWHARLGHTNKANIDRLIKNRVAIPSSSERDRLCGGCSKGKQTVESFPKSSSSKTSRVLELVHADVIGPIETRAPGGACFVLKVVDDYSRFVSVYFLKSKGEVTERFSEFTLLMENQLGQRLKSVRSDNGGEFMNRPFARLFHDRGIIHQRSTPYSPQQKGVAE
ncbi:hypothetical protein PybrP1_006765 [[Pythium] brassicae (nom. inval.)]|nr:hypothetical protein PybrP1_006765 [[Pythium] brassicae (nom. inval.)]